MASELATHFEGCGLGKFAPAIMDVTHAESVGDLALLSEAMVEAVIPEAGLKFVSAVKFRQCVAAAVQAAEAAVAADACAAEDAAVKIGAAASAEAGLAKGADRRSSMRRPQRRRSSLFTSMEDELYELTAANKHVMSWMCSSECTLESLVEVVVDSVYKLVACECCTLYFVDRVKAELWIAVARDKEVEGYRIPIGEGISGKVAATCLPYNTKDCQKDEHWHSNVDGQTGFVSQTMLCVPVFVPGSEAVAVLQVMNRTRPAVSDRLSSQETLAAKVSQLETMKPPYSFDDHDQHVLSNFGLLVALAVQKCSAELVLNKLTKDMTSGALGRGAEGETKGGFARERERLRTSAREEGGERRTERARHTRCVRTRPFSPVAPPSHQPASPRPPSLRACRSDRRLLRANAPVVADDRRGRRHVSLRVFLVRHAKKAEPIARQSGLRGQLAAQRRVPAPPAASPQMAVASGRSARCGARGLAALGPGRACARGRAAVPLH